MARHDTELRLNDWFCGAGGSTQAIATIPGVKPIHAANHWDRAIESHSANFPDVDHHTGDIRELDVRKLPYAELFWASPECPQWTVANGKTRTYVNTDEPLPGMEPVRDVEAERSRALMEEVPMYLRAMAARGKPVLAGVVENVIDVRAWSDWDRWVEEIRAVGYRTRVIALNSMHAESLRTPRAPQSRDRLYLAYWHVSLGRDPDWDKWLRPTAWCPTCDEQVQAVQAFKEPGADMGRYRSQYVYRCPRVTCRRQIVEPNYVPAHEAIDWTIPGERIGDRPLREFFADKAKTQSLGFHPLSPKTLARIEAGIRRYARPITAEVAGNTFERRPGVRTWPVDAPFTAQTTTATKAIAVPPLLVPVEGRLGVNAAPAGLPLRTQTARHETGVVTVPFIAELRGGGSVARPVSDILATVTASGNHHGLVMPPLIMRNNTARGDQAQMLTPVGEALRTLTTAGHQSLVTVGDWPTLHATDPDGFRALLAAAQAQAPTGGHALPNVEDCYFRMLEPAEIGRGMAFLGDYRVLGNKREVVRQYGNAVTPPAAEVIGCALVEAITGEQLDRSAA